MKTMSLGKLETVAVHYAVTDARRAKNWRDYLVRLEASLVWHLGL